MTLDAHVTGIWCGQIGGGVGNVRYEGGHIDRSLYNNTRGS